MYVDVSISTGKLLLRGARGYGKPKEMLPLLLPKIKEMEGMRRTHATSFLQKAFQRKS